MQIRYFISNFHAKFLKFVNFILQSFKKKKLMSSRRLTIFVEETPEEGLEISVNLDKDFVPLFNERFISVEPPYPIHLLSKEDVINDNATDSVTISILSHLIERLGKSLKSEGHFITKEKMDNVFTKFWYFGN